MPRFSPLALLALLLAAPAPAQPTIVCQRGQCVAVFTGHAGIRPQLRVDARGSVSLQAGVANDLQYSVKVAVRAAGVPEARRLVQHYHIRIANAGDWSVLTVPGEPLAASVVLRAPKLAAAHIVTADGPVEATGIDGPLTVDSMAGALSADRIRGDCRLSTRGGAVRAGQILGALNITTGLGAITVASVAGEAVLQTMGGDITAQNAGARVSAETGAGAIRIGHAGGPVDATTGAGLIRVGSANGLVTAHNMAGLIDVGSAAGAHCESSSGSVQLGRIAGSLRVSAAMGNIVASLLSPAPDSFLATRDGDITIAIPSNLGVTIQAENAMADSLRRICSDFPQLQARRMGTRIVAQGQLNGGGPLLRVSSEDGAIFIKRQ